MEQRLAILLQGGVIDQDIHDGMLNVITELEQQWNISIRHSQGNMALTHMASALMRSRRGESIAPIDNEVLEEVQQSEQYPSLVIIHQALLRHFPLTIDPSEEGYLLANLYSLMLAANDR
ncbi:PRD domain-containing protein [Limnobaculum zhutongyuii]|uniref:PRD domain-containing protein n=1 Tax=Limnobaculum zhutongyuii TaxID=2498113 RepID=A0A411WNB1_9GAMM|nr:PRD domain-containing protein [Limnobaculum zhutongyuii]QBH97713.1 PRD domain-containing protein [Limnobaculum zhutongyuii]TQS86816.1 PRD domain-containing protein [Limnobaculum zhutongyuii]